MLGSIEAGGTKFVCAVGNDDLQVIDKVSFPTTTPEETLANCVDYFCKFPEVEAISIASFGPIELRKKHAKYGFITNTPKPFWADTDFVGYMKEHLNNIPVFWTTDVNGSAYGEYLYAQEQNQEVDALVYYTIGTGVGGGAVINGRFMGTTGHPEMGHVRVKRHADDESFAGICPFHGDCLEGLVAGPTFDARLGRPGKEVPLTEPVWDIMADYIAQAVLQTTLTLRPNKIVLGGGVIGDVFLNKIRESFKTLMNGYVEVGDLNEYIVMPAFPDNGSATYGNFSLAKSLVK